MILGIAAVGSLVWAASARRRCRDDCVEHWQHVIAWRKELLGKPGENDELNQRYIRELETILKQYQHP